MTSPQRSTLFTVASGKSWGSPALKAGHQWHSKIVERRRSRTHSSVIANCSPDANRARAASENSEKMERAVRRSRANSALAIETLEDIIAAQKAAKQSGGDSFERPPMLQGLSPSIDALFAQEQLDPLPAARPFIKPVVVPKTLTNIRRVELISTSNKNKCLLGRRRPTTLGNRRRVLRADRAKLSGIRGAQDRTAHRGGHAGRGTGSTVRAAALGSSSSASALPDLLHRGIDRGTCRDNGSDSRELFRASAAVARGDLRRALQLYSRICVGAQAHSVRTAFTAFFARGDVRARLGDSAGAKADFAACIKLRPESALAHYNHGVVSKRLGDVVMAARDFSRAIALDPTNPTFYHNRGFVLRQQGEFGAAKDDYVALRKVAKARIDVKRGVETRTGGDVRTQTARRRRKLETAGGSVGSSGDIEMYGDAEVATEQRPIFPKPSMTSEPNAEEARSASPALRLDEGDDEERGKMMTAPSPGESLVAELEAARLAADETWGENPSSPLHTMKLVPSVERAERLQRAIHSRGGSSSGDGKESSRTSMRPKSTQRAESVRSCDEAEVLAAHLVDSTPEGRSGLLADLPREDLIRVCGAVTERHLRPGSYVFKQSAEPADSWFIVLNGKVKVSVLKNRPRSKTSPRSASEAPSDEAVPAEQSQKILGNDESNSHSPRNTKELGHGTAVDGESGKSACFNPSEEDLMLRMYTKGGAFGGGDALLKGLPRNSTAQATEPTDLLVLPRSVWLATVRRYETRELDKRVDSLRSFPCFAKWRSTALRRLARSARSVRFPAGATVLSEGANARYAFFLVRGLARAIKNVEVPGASNEKAGDGALQVQIAQMCSGDTFGETAVTQPLCSTYDYTVVCETPALIVVIDRNLVDYNSFDLATKTQLSRRTVAIPPNTMLLQMVHDKLGWGIRKREILKDLALQFKLNEHGEYSSDHRVRSYLGRLGTRATAFARDSWDLNLADDGDRRSSVFALDSLFDDAVA